MILYVFIVALSPGCGKHIDKEAITTEGTIGWKENFIEYSKSHPLDKKWVIKGIPGTPMSEFTVKKNSKDTFLQAKSNNSTGNLITQIKDIDLKKTPYLEWKWRVQELPADADGRYKNKDDQAMGIYIGTGSLLSKKVISYRWDTDTPKGTEGKSVYGAGTVKVKWITLENKQSERDKWITEKRNCAEDFKKAWGFVPDKIYISVSSNSQYTGSSALAELDWIRFLSGENIR